MPQQFAEFRDLAVRSAASACVSEAVCAFVDAVLSQGDFSPDGAASLRKLTAEMRRALAESRARFAKIRQRFESQP
jgi:hypothetical protein